MKLIKWLIKWLINGLLFVLLMAFMLLVVPSIIGIVVSTPGASWLVTEGNEWIGFWGGYIGSIIGGLITLFVMNFTIMDGRISQELVRRQELCNRVASLVANFCVEMMAYRSKMNTLEEKAGGARIDQKDKIDFGATKEEPQRIFFEIQILLSCIGEANDLLQMLDESLKMNITELSLKEASGKMHGLRKVAIEFSKKYTNSKSIRKGFIFHA